MAPRNFFSDSVLSATWQEPVIYMVVCVLVHVTMVALLSRNIAFATRSLVMGLCFPFITAAILFLILTRVFKAAGSYLAALQVTAYVSAVTLFSWMSGVGLVLEFYRIYLMSVGLALIFSVRMFQAFCAIAGTMAAYIVGSLLLNAVSGGRLLELLH